jgi:hypothetical protein
VKKIKNKIAELEFECRNVKQNCEKLQIQFEKEANLHKDKMNELQLQKKQIL